MIQKKLNILNKEYTFQHCGIKKKDELLSHLQRTGAGGRVIQDSYNFMKECFGEILFVDKDKLTVESFENTAEGLQLFEVLKQLCETFLVTGILPSQELIDDVNIKFTDTAKVLEELKKN